MKHKLFVLFFLVPVFLYASFPVKYNPDFDITDYNKTFLLKYNKVTVSVDRPLKPMKNLLFTFSFKEPNVKSIFFSSNMEMNMGKYEFSGVKIDNNTFTLTQILTKCMSGKTKWYTSALITYNNEKQEILYFFYDVK